MKIVAKSPHQARPVVTAGLAVHGERGTSWRLLVALGVAGLVLQLPVLAKPIADCAGQEPDSHDPVSCLTPPERFASANQANEPAKVARVTLDNIDAAAPNVIPGGTSSADGEVASIADCSDLRGTHEAQSLMLQTVQQQLTSVAHDRRVATNSLNTLRSGGANEAQLTFAASQLTKINAVWSALTGDVQRRTKNFNTSMSQLTKVCLRG